MPQTPITKSTLKTADPRIVPTPMSPFVTNTPKKENKLLSESTKKFPTEFSGSYREIQPSKLTNHGSRNN